MKHRISLHELPRFWDGSVLFVANILSIFFGNQNETDELRTTVGSLESYGGRLVPILNLFFPSGNNLLVLEQSPNPALLDYFESLGLSLPECRVLPKDFAGSFRNHDKKLTLFLESLKNHPSKQMLGYVIDEGLGELAAAGQKQIIGSVKGCRAGNNKFLLHSYLKETGLPVFDTFMAQTPEEVPRALEQVKNLGYQFAVAKAQIGASGIGIKKVRLSEPEGALEVPGYLFHEGPVMIQGWLDESVEGVRYVGSPSVQLFAEKDTCTFYDITEQILSAASVHEGNIAPPPCLEGYSETTEQMLEQSKAVGEWLAAQGYRGTASIDFHIIVRDKKTEVRACEVNARVTGATYPSILAKHFRPRHTWLMRNIRFQSPLKGATILEKMKSADILFRRDSSEGVLPFNFNAHEEDQVVKAQVLFLAESLKKTRSLLDKLDSLFALKGDYDRD